MSTPFFDGTGGTYFTRSSPLACTLSYPFWVSMWVKPQRYPGGQPDPYTLWASAKADMSNGTWGMMWGQALYGGLLQAWTADGSGSSKAESEECLLSDPYWDHCIMELRSATDRRVYINGTRDIGGTDTTSRTINLSSGSPVTRIGIDAAGLKAFFGNIAGVCFGTGLLNDTDRNLLANSDHFTGLPTLTAGTITNYFELDGNGNDSVGSEDLTAVGTVNYDPGYPKHDNRIYPITTRPEHPTRKDLIQFIHKTDQLHTELPTVVPGQASPVSTSGWTNLDSVEWFNISFTTADGQPGACRFFHYIPTVGSQDHCVFINNGHAGTNEWPTYNTDLMIKCLIRDGFGVCACTMPHFGDADTGVELTGHDAWSVFSGNDPYVSDTFNAIEAFVAPTTIAMNNLVDRYSKRSHIGLSGGGWTLTHVGAMDIRFNHALVPDRGTMPDRRYPPPKDFEQNPYPNGWKVEEYYAHCGVGNRRFWLTTHTVDTNFWVGSRGDLDASNFDAKFLAPIRAANPFADVQFKLDTGSGTSSTHKFYQSTYDDIFYPALTTALPTVYSSDLLLGGMSYHPFAFTHDAAGWADDVLYSPSVSNSLLVVTAALNEAADAASIALSVRVAAVAAIAEAGDAAAMAAGLRVAISGAIAEGEDTAAASASVALSSSIAVQEEDDTGALEEPLVIDPNFLILAGARARSVIPAARRRSIIAN